MNSSPYPASRPPAGFGLRAWFVALSFGSAAGLTLAALGFGSVAGRASAAPPAGRLLAAQCAQCHGTNGQAVSGFESIRGKSADDMFKTLWEMKNRPVETIMDRQARGYTDAQLRLIAEYLATLPAAPADEVEN